MSTVTIERVRKRFVVDGLAATERRKPPAREYRRALAGEAETHPVALSCSKPPEGEAGWSMRLLAKRLVELRIVETMSDETVPRVLKRTHSSRGSGGSGASRQRPAALPLRVRAAQDGKPIPGLRAAPGLAPLRDCPGRDRQLAAQRVEILAT